MSALLPQYVAHLADDNDRNSTCCGEPWQGWQAPEHARHEVPPHQQPRPHLDAIRSCGACHRRTLEVHPDTNPNRVRP